MSAFPGYAVVEQIDETLHSVVFRAHREDPPGTVIIKALRAEYPTPAEVARLKHEYQIIRGLNVEGIVRVLDVLDAEGGVALVLEDFGGVALKEVIRGGLPVKRFLELAICLADILGHLHQNNISHRDIKPANIIVGRESGTVKVTDFGIAAEFTRQSAEFYNPEIIQGALAYISPEQTGRMNCAVDYRTDLYSLGVTFYEMLTGQLPFTSSDAMEMIHAHIARVPPAPAKLRQGIPTVVSDIVMRLMSKAAADRYQNCFGLAADLRECLARLELTGGIEPFDLGRQDVSLRFIIPQIVVGRDAELAVLHAAFDRVARGAVEVMLVQGEPGIGKSALVKEIHKPILAKRGYFISGKYDQFRRSVPYSSIIQAFQSLARQILAESDERVREWKTKILRSLGPNGKIITDAIPEVELIIGPQPDIPDLGPEETQNRFNLCCRNFVRVFADASHPLVLFLDDLQWADSASLHLIETIATDGELRCLLFIGAYRDTEVPPHHPLSLTLETMRRTGLTINTVTLGGLRPVDVNQFIANFLRCPPESSQPLAYLMQAKTRGNPFFVNQFLKTLYAERCIVLDPVRGWTWDMVRIQEMQVTDNVVQFMAERIHVLAPAPRRLLQTCAVIGNRFDAVTLASVAGQPLEEVLITLDALIQEGLVNRRGDRYRFHHDRIQEAAYSLLTPAERERIHFEIGIMELQRTPPDQLFNRIFYIVDQLNQGKAHICSPAGRRRLAELNLEAGIKAKESTAYAAAAAYLSAGRELLAADSWQADYQLTYDLHKQLMECQFLNRDFEEAERLSEVIVAMSRTRVDKARVYTTMVVVYTSLRSPREAIELGLAALKLFGIHISIDVGKAPVAVELIKARAALRRRKLEDILELPRMQDEELLAAHDLMLSIATPAYYVNANLFALLVLKGVNASLRYGHVPHAALAFAALATIVENAQGDYALGYRLGEMALKLNERLDNRSVAGQVHHIFAFFIQHWKRHIRYDLAVYPKVYELSINAGDFIYAGHSINAAGETRLRISPRLDDVLDDLKRYQEFMDVLQDPLITAQYRALIRYILVLKGASPLRDDLSGDGFDMAAYTDHFRKEGHHFGLCLALLPRAILLSWYGRYEEALEVSTEIDQHVHVPIGALLVVDHYFYYSLILTALLAQGEVKRRQKFTDILRRNQRKMRTWAALCPENFQHKHDLVAAEMAALAGRPNEAIRLYHAAIEGARRNDYLHDEARACEHLALYYLTRDLGGEAGLFMQRAHHLYRSWGASAKQKDLEERYPDLVRGEARPGLPGNMEQTSAGSRLLDLSAVMQVSQVISSEIMLDRLLQKIMHMSITTAGAQLGYLCLESDARLTVEASEDVGAHESRVLQSTPLEDCKGLSVAIINYVSRSGTPVILANAAQEGAFMNDPHVISRRCQSILCTPILNKGKLYGILYMENNLAAGAFTPDRLEILGIIAAQAAISLENAKLFDLATTDGLTKLFVHRYFHILLDQEVQRSRRYGQSFSLAMIDIDNFKEFNDTCGHQVGDEVLRHVARAIRQNTRTVDISARYGGEEFAVILPETDLEAGLVAAEKLRRSIEEMEIRHSAGSSKLTVSIGLAAFPHHASDKDGLIRSADGALYASKKSGKNRVSVGESTAS